MLNRIVKNRYFNIIRMAAYYVLVLSISVCTLLRFINWQDYCEPWIVPFIINALYFLRKFFSIPVLFLSELLCVLDIFIEHKDKKQFRSLVIVLFMMAVSLVVTGDMKTIYFLCMIYFARYVSFSGILNTHILGKLLILVVIIVGNVLNIVYIAPQRGNGFGMVHYNTFSQFLMFLLFAIVCRFNSGNDKKLIFTVAAIALAVLCICPIDSRTPVVVLALFVVLMWSEKLYNKLGSDLKKVLKVLFVLFPIMLVFVSWVLGIMIVDGGLGIDQNLGARFVEYVYAYRDLGLSLFPRNITMGNGTGLYYFDNQYARLIFDSGLIYCALAYVGFIGVNCKASRDDNYILMIILICLYIDGTSGGLFDNELIVVLMTYIFAGSSINDFAEKDE